VRYLSVAEVVELHSRVLSRFRGAPGIRDQGALESSVAQPLQAFGGEDLYSSVIEKAAALGYFLATNHPFVDGNKRVAHAAMETTLLLNGFEIRAGIEEQEHVMLLLASGTMSRAEFTSWLERHVAPGA